MRLFDRTTWTLALLSLFVGLLAVAEGGGDARWLAPATRLDDGRFVNPVGPLRHGTLGVRVPFMFRRIRASFGVRAGAPVHVAGRLEIDDWGGRRRARLRIEDAAPAR